MDMDMAATMDITMNPSQAVKYPRRKFKPVLDMEIIQTKIDGLLIIKPKVFSDERGYFFESWNQDSFSKNGININFVQDNQSLSQKGVLRGLHFQNPPYAQAKLVRVIQGAVLDVAVDIRAGSPTYGQHVSIELNAENKLQFFIPEGFAHGFLTLSDDTIFSYKCSAYYNKASEGCLLWNDPGLAIAWNTDHPTLSDKDLEGNKFHSFASLF
jgi:dTDP-4-dehydrorhamnose 3,5-epimerase